jgi:hypothetical protein
MSKEDAIKLLTKEAISTKMPRQKENGNELPYRK